MKDFNIHAKLQEELTDFFGTKVKIASSGQSKKGRTKIDGYEFNQFETVQLIEYYTNDKFETGDIDAEGQQKLFLNVVSFPAEVASKQIDLDVKNFNFIPEVDTSVWNAYFANREFRDWCKENYFGEMLNDSVDRFPKYGTVVSKRVGKTIVPVPLINLRNKQDAKDLLTAEYVIEEHPNMTLAEMEEYPDWDTEKLDIEWDEKVTVYERYGRVPLNYFKKYKGEKTSDKDNRKSIDVLAILTLDKANKADDCGGAVLFMEEIKRRPYEEVHYARQDGRWLGIGEVEKNFTNQVARNMVFNLRKRALQWSARKIFQSTDETVSKNLIREVRDGDVLQVSATGAVTQVDTTTRTLSEFQAMDNVVDENTRQRSFTFEVATGEALPSGTPFRLGVILSNATNSYYGLKQEKLGLFWKRVVWELIWPTFKKENRKERIITLFANEDGVESLKLALAEKYVQEEVKKAMFSPKFGLPDIPTLKEQAKNAVMEMKELFAKLEADYYDNAKMKLELDITGESFDYQKKIETLTNLYTIMSQKGDPRAERILRRLLAISGENIDLYGQVLVPEQAMQGTPASGSLPKTGSGVQAMDQMVSSANMGNSEMTV